MTSERYSGCLPLSKVLIAEELRRGALEKEGCPALGRQEGPRGAWWKAGCYRHTPFTLLPALSQDFRRVRASPKCCCRRFPTWSRVLERSLSARTAPALPDCRRPWCTWVDASSWEAFFRRSGLWRYRLGSAPKRDNQAFGILSPLAWTLPIPDHNSAAQPSSRGHKTPELPPLPSSVLFHPGARGRVPATSSTEP